MTTFVHFFQNCFRVEDNSIHTQEFQAPITPQTIGLERQGRGEKDGTHEPAPSLQYCDDHDSTEGTRDDATPHHLMMTPRIQGFGFMLRNIFQRIENGLLRETNLPKKSHHKFVKVVQEANECDGSPLRVATGYSSLHDIPSIALEEVVMPGSRLQKQMSLCLQDKGILSESSVDECVICMDAFEESNPKMPTLCGCGENKAFFHLPCLYQWVEKCKDCPSCRMQLNWQEF